MPELSSSQRDVLAVVARLHDDRPPNNNTVSAKADINPGYISDVLSELEKAGYIRRTADPSDRRSVLNVLTSDGFDKVKSLEEQYATVSKPTGFYHDA